MYYVKPENGEGKFLNSLNYIRVSPSSGCYIQAAQNNAQGIVVDGTPYSTNVESPIPDIEVATVTHISEWGEEIQEEYNTILCDEAKVAKISELVALNDQAIDAGTTVTLSTGEENFTYTMADQSNISEMFMAVVMGATEYSYHQNGESCRMFNAGDIMTLYGTLSMYKTGLLTYFNQLKNYVGTLTSVEDIQAVTYGQELTGEYLANYNNLMAKNKAQLDKVIENLTQKGE